MAPTAVLRPHPTLVKHVWRARASGKQLDLPAEVAALVGFTEANFLYLIESALGTPYLFGGIDPFHGGADCSGLIYWACAQLGFIAPRTTETEWQQLKGSTDWRNAPIASLIELEVPSDGGAPPQHVGIKIANGTYIDDPHTGAVVRVEAIPNFPGSIWPIGYRVLPFTSAPPAPSPSPSPTPTQEVDVQLDQNDPKTGGLWVTDENGALYCWGAAPFVAGLNQHPEYHAGETESAGQNPCVGIGYWSAFGQDGIVFFTKPTTGVGGWAGTPYSQYFFTRAGTVASIDHVAGVVHEIPALPRTQPVTDSAPLAA